MTSDVTSGLGRNGPWLQNRWLRVETRLDDGAISPVALDGAFRPVERALASARLAGADDPAFARFDYNSAAHEDELGAGRVITLSARDARAGLALRREVVLYDAFPFVVTRVGLTNEQGIGVGLEELAAFRTADGRGRLQLKSAPADLRIYRHGWQSWSPTMSLAGASVDLRSAPPVLAPEPSGAGAGNFACDDVGVLFDPASGRSILVGAVTARDFLTQVVVDVPNRSLDARCLADGIVLAPGETVWSERVAVDLVGTPQEQLARYGDALGELMGARVPQRTPAGWCSWYYFYQDVTEADVLRNLRFLEAHRDDLPVETVQIDDGYQADIGDWLTVNEKFPHGMRWLASEIRSAGFTPGIWLAPFLLADSSRTFAEHPEFVVHDADAGPALAMHNWQRRNYGLDGTHPGAQAWLTDLFREISDGWGYDYLKIDFLFGAAITGRRYDRGATRVRAYRAALRAVRAGAGDRRFVLGCGSLMAPSVGFFDGNRIGLDVAPFWRFLTTDERRRPQPRPRMPHDVLSAEGAVRNTLNRWWMHGRLWANDPDCLLVRTDRTKLSLEEVRTLAAVIGLSAGMMLSSDDLPSLPAERRELISMLLPPLPHAAVPCDLMDTDMPGRFELDCDGRAGPARVVGMFNFEDEAHDLVLPLPPGRWHAIELWGERYVGAYEREVTFALVEPHGSRVVALSPANDDAAPRAIASTAHIGMGCLDIASSHFEPGTGKLSVALLPVGRAPRRVFVSTGGRRPIEARLNGDRVEIGGRGDVRYLDITALGAITFEVQLQADEE